MLDRRKPHPLRQLPPSAVWIDSVGCLIDALGKAEIEFAGAIVVLYHQAKGLTEWSPLLGSQIADFMGESELVHRWARNPMWRPDPRGLIEKEWVIGWEGPDAPGAVTEDFIIAVSNRGWHRERKALRELEQRREAVALG